VSARKEKEKDLLKPLNRETAVFFAHQFRDARLKALGDAEEFDQIIHVIERLGSYMTGKQDGLGKYTDSLNCLAAKSSLAEVIPDRFRCILTPFSELYESVRVGRNDALHQGAFARHLTNHAIELAIILEDALSHIMEAKISHYMTRNPACAELWQPVAFIRQQMLGNSYSYMPVLESGEEQDQENEWSVVSDVAIAKYLGAERGSNIRRTRLTMTLEQARNKGLELRCAKAIDEKTTITEALEHLGSEQVLLIKGPKRRSLLGIVTAFDLL